MRRLPLLPLAAGAVMLAFTACESDQAIATDPIGAPAYGIRLNNAATNLPRGTVSIGATGADTIRVTLAGIDTLETGFWTLWATDSTGANFRRLTGTLRVTRTDTVINALGDPEAQSFTFTRTDVSAFQNGGANSGLLFTTTRTQSGIPAAERIGFIFLSLESTADATTPSEVARPLWFTRPVAQLTTASSGNLTFGYFDLDAPDRYVYVSGAQRGRVYVRGDVMLVNDSSLPRPPRGYFYAAYAIKRDAGNTPTDTLYFGPQRSPAPRRDISLFDADVQVVDPLVQVGNPAGILAASNRVEAADFDLTGENPFRELSQALVVLELKQGKTMGRLGPNFVLLADLPTVVSDR